MCAQRNSSTSYIVTRAKSRERMLQNSTMNRYSRSQQANCKIIYILVLVFMAIAAGAVALVTEKDVTELRAALKQNQKKIRNCQQQARREAVALRKGGLSCHAVRRVLAVYLVSNWDLKLAMLAAQTALPIAAMFCCISNARFCQGPLCGTQVGRFLAGA